MGDLAIGGGEGGSGPAMQPGTGGGGSPRRVETVGDTRAERRAERGEAEARSEEDRQRVRGIFSLTQIARQLGLQIHVPEIARTFAEIEAALTR